MRNTTIGMVVAGLILAFIAYLREGFPAVIHGLQVAWQTLFSASLLIIAAFLLAGLMQVLITRNMINRWLGRGSGWRGLMLGALAGSAIPGGPYGYYPLLASVIQGGADVGPLMAFIGGKAAWSLTRLPLEFAFLGPYLTLVRYAITLPVPIMMALIAQLLFPDAAADLRRWQLAQLGEGSQEGGHQS